MPKSFLCFVISLFALTVLLIQTSNAALKLQINLSYKVILNPADGTPPFGLSVGTVTTNIQDAVTNMNALMVNNGVDRDINYGFDHEVIFIGGTSTPISLNWFNDNIGTDTVYNNLVSDIKSNPGSSGFDFKDDRVNLYINNNTTFGGNVLFPMMEMMLL